jgi:hypothetical protein
MVKRTARCLANLFHIAQKMGEDAAGEMAHGHRAGRTSGDMRLILLREELLGERLSCCRGKSPRPS